MPTLFHGTRHSFATTMAKTSGGIKVNSGGGEFGRGFYTQNKQANALAWAINKFPHNANPCVLKLEVDDASYMALNIRLLDLNDAKKLTQKLRSKGTTRTHTEGCDVVVGPLNQSRFREQQKFESANSEALLNGTNTIRTVV